MKIEIDIPELNITEVQLQDLVVAEIVRQKTSEVVFENSYNAQLQTAVKEEIDKRMPAIIEESFTREFVVTGRFGDSPKTTTFHEMMVSHSLEWFNQKVNRNGEVDKYCRGNTSRGVYIMNKMCEKMFKEDLKKHAQRIAQQMKDNLSESFTKEVSDRLGRLLR